MIRVNVEHDIWSTAILRSQPSCHHCPKKMDHPVRRGAPAAQAEVETCQLKVKYNLDAAELTSSPGLPISSYAPSNSQTIQGKKCHLSSSCKTGFSFIRGKGGPCPQEAEHLTEKRIREPHSNANIHVGFRPTTCLALFIKEPRS